MDFEVFDPVATSAIGRGSARANPGRIRARDNFDQPGLSPFDADQARHSNNAVAFMGWLRTMT
jgi:hypothetical protein